VLIDLIEVYSKTDDKSSVGIVVLNIENRMENHQIVNVLQNLATIVVQNSIQEGFGLTLTEAMYKAKPCVCSSAHGLSLQI
jgi:trehalose synthase